MSDFKAKMHQNRFRPRPRLGSLQLSPDFLAGFKDPTSKGAGGESLRSLEEWEGREERGEGGEGRPPSRIGKVKRWQPYCWHCCPKNACDGLGTPYDVRLQIALKSQLNVLDQLNRPESRWTQLIQSDCNVANIPIDSLEHIVADRTAFRQLTCARTFC